MKRFAPSLDNPWFVAVLYTVLTVGVTWPLASVMTTEIAWDLGDPVFNCWIMMWTGGQVLRFLKGDLTALNDFWNGNIFYPEKLTIAYSEHLTPQMLQILPVYAATGNMVLCYNLLFLSAIVLCGLGMYLLVRELTGQPIAAFVAGVAFALSPYRVDQFAHLQVMSSQWMPLALYGFRRYFSGGRTRALVGGTTALVVQVLSCFYYLFFFVPFAAAYCLYEIATHGLWRNFRVWRQVTIAAVISLLVIAPFLLPYVKVRDVAGMGVRSASEIATFSADTWAFATVSENLTFWGPRLQTFPRAEGNGFPGLTILALGFLGALVIIVRAARHARTTGPASTPWWRKAAGALVAIGVLSTIGAWVLLLIWGPGTTHLLGVRITLRELPIIITCSLSALMAAALFPGVWRFLRGVPRSAAGFMLVGWLLAVILALGPEIQAHGKTVVPGPYALLYHYVPGFNGMRVPARFFMVATLFLTCLGGFGLAALAARWRRVAYAVAVVAIGGIVFESAVTPFVTNKRLWVEHFDLAPRHLATERTMGPVYERVRDLPDGTILAEFPYGSPPFDIQATFYAGFHRKPMINGFSGFFPKSFQDRMPTLGWDPTDRAAAWQTLKSAGATHVVVHEAAYFDGKGEAISDWLRTAGAKELVANGSDRLFALR
jgi:hypothetical protein